jgi:replication initiation protein RepC
LQPKKRTLRIGIALSEGWVASLMFMQQEILSCRMGAALPGRAITSHTLKIKTIADTFQGLPEGVTRYDLLDLVKRVGREMGFTPRLITHLEYLVRYTQDQDWLAGRRPIVYQTVTTMAHELGLGERQINNLERQLHALGALTWQDSGNHRRHGCRDGTGRIRFAYGIDLSPLSALYDRLEACAIRLTLYKSDWSNARRQVSVLRKNVRRLLKAASDAALSPPLTQVLKHYQDSYEAMEERITAHSNLENLKQRITCLEDLEDQLTDFVRTIHEATDPIHTDTCAYPMKITDQSEIFYSHNNTKIQLQSSIKEDTSNPSVDESGSKKISSRAYARQPKAGSTVASYEATAGLSHKRKNKKGLVSEKPRLQAHEKPIAGDITLNRPLSTGIELLTLQQVYRAASPSFQGLIGMDHPIGWPEIVDAAKRICPYLGIHQSAWADACLQIGANAAAICVLIADRRGDDPENPVRIPGGFLRGCLSKAHKGELRLHQSIFGLISRQGAFDA